MKIKIITAILNVVAVLFLLFIIGCMILTISSCNVAKKVARAEQTVITNPSSLNNVGLVWLNLHPQKIDTITTYVEGLNTNTEVFIVDTVAQANAIKELQKKYTIECNQAVKEAYDSGVTFAIKSFVKLPAKVRVDTIKITKIDIQMVNLFKDSLARSEKRIERLEQSNIQLSGEVVGAKKERNTMLYWLIGAIALGIATNLVQFKMKLW